MQIENIKLQDETMQIIEFVSIVKERGEMDSSQKAMDAIQSTLLTLSERMFGYEAQNLAQQLPEEVRMFLRLSEERQPFSLQEFYRRVALREAVDMDKAVFHAQAVMAAVEDAVPEEEVNNLRAQFPDEYDEIFAPEHENGKQPPPREEGEQAENGS
jgi:uncharacterized protein (DUF2267 family)